MSGEIEAAGAAVTAGLAAGAVEGHGGGGHVQGLCSNCGSELDGKFCAACGQPGHLHRSLGHMVEEFFHGILHFDTKAWRTLPMLVFRPGTLTHDYVHGKRARFVSPLAFFLFAVFLMFFVFAMLGERELKEPKTRADLRAHISSLDTRLTASGIPTERRAEIAEERGGLVRELAKLDQQAADLASVRPILVSKIDAARQSGDEESLALLESTLRRVDAALGPDETGLEFLRVAVNASGGLNIDFTETSFVREAIAEGMLTADGEGLMIRTGDAKLDKKIAAKLKNPDYLWYKIENTAYKFAFLLVPLGLPFVWLVFFWKRGVTLFDHTVFLLYSLTFVSLMFVVAISLGRAPIPAAAVVAGFLPFTLPVHIFFQLKGGYALGVFSALWRTLVLMVFSAFCLLLFLAGVLVIGLLG